MVGALATCTVTLREGPPLMPGSLGLQPQLPQPWAGISITTSAVPLAPPPPCEKSAPLQMYSCVYLWCPDVLDRKKKKTLFVMLSTSCRLRGETKRVSSATIILTSPMIDFPPQAIRLKLGVPRGLSG